MKILSLFCMLLISTFSGNSKIYQFKMKTIDGQLISLAEYEGKTILIVNVASRCGFTPQYKELQKLYETYKEKGFVILGFPANNFMGQEPGNDEKIKTFCTTEFGVSFPMFSKISVKGKDMNPLYEYLTKKEKNGVGDFPVKWNFQKFLIDKKGNLVTSFSPTVKPESEEIKTAIEKLLSAN